MRPACCTPAPPGRDAAGDPRQAGPARSVATTAGDRTRAFRDARRCAGARAAVAVHGGRPSPAVVLPASPSLPLPR
ncbi:hypothetical protein BU14_0818s0006 [Porphyra umbilicalis]|uniref:Uncharacterized protein n=1 Tax=Porphyra umbilicalis TaxID=2786 RepID=A0A1X6NNW5_PORUM|nr:hypothetical protein BU14_0818s0006 [Porphyra umbilicalis]|eukprot:OSX70277.1 hypothetical protein BU14_0818s0006 [Porphyra umbilicalis]